MKRHVILAYGILLVAIPAVGIASSWASNGWIIGESVPDEIASSLRGGKCYGVYTYTCDNEGSCSATNAVTLFDYCDAKTKTTGYCGSDLTNSCDSVTTATEDCGKES
jgi:hypothetical protein